MIPDELAVEEWECKGTRYRFIEALPLEGFDILEALRPGLRALSTSVREAAIGYVKGAPKKAMFISLAFDVIGEFPHETIQSAIRLLTPHIEFTREGVPSPVKANKDLAGAMKGQSPHLLYELLVRAFCVNFKESSAELMSLWERLQADDGAAKEAAGSETSDPSSPIPSTPD